MPRAFLVMAVAPAGCPSRPPVGPPPPPAGNITWKRVETEADVPRAPPAPGTYRIHLIDVGTRWIRAIRRARSRSF
jgi:hypothetical protein